MGEPQAEATRRCQTCGATGIGSPPGWYRVLINDPTHTRGYRSFGVYCGSECLAAKLPETAQLLGQIDVLRAEVEAYRAKLGPDCERCQDQPPAGFSCMACGAEGAA